MNFEGPKPTHDEALAALRKFPDFILKEPPEAVVERWETFTKEIPIGTEVTNARDPLSKGFTMDGRHYNNPTDNYVNIKVNVVFRGLWRVVDVVKVEPTSQDK